MSSPRRLPDPFGPLEGIVSALLGLALVGALVGAVMLTMSSVHGDRGEFSLTGDGGGCAVVSNEVAAATGMPQRGIDRDAASVHAEQVEICLDHPTALQRFASELGSVGDLVLGIGALVLVRRVIRTGRRSGLFTVTLARQVQRLGWWLLVMSLVWPFVAAAGRGVVVQAAVPSRSWTDALFDPRITIGMVVASLGVITVARVLRRAVLLQGEVDATV
jgi:hypothetical protein